MKWIKTIAFIIVCFVLQNETLAQGPPPGFPYISEIMYNPPELGPDSLEFVEITADYIAGSPTYGDYFSSGIDFAFPADFYLSPSQSVVIARDSVAFENVFNVQAFQWSNSSLLNTGEPIVLSRSNGVIIDSIYYQTSSPWPEDSDGTGRSIEFCSIEFGYNNNPANWAASQNNTGVIVNGMTIYASPGVHTGNCITVDVEEIIESESFQAYPNPTNGGFTLSISEFDDDAVFSIRDLKGALVYLETIASGTGKLEKQMNLARGMYLLKLVVGEKQHTQYLMVTE